MNLRILHHKVVMVAHASIISESEVPIAVLCLLCLSCYTAVRIKTFQKQVCNHSSHYEKYYDTTHPTESDASIALLCQLCLTRYTTVRIKKCSKSISALKVATMKNTDDFSLRKGSHHVQPPN